MYQPRGKTTNLRQNVFLLCGCHGKITLLGQKLATSLGSIVIVVFEIS